MTPVHPSMEKTWTCEPTSSGGRRHRLKCWPEPFAATWANTKPYEIRHDDRGYRVGDELELAEYVPDRHNIAGKGYYTGREVLARVTHKTDGGKWGLPRGLCILGMAIVERRDGTAQGGDSDIVEHVTPFGRFEHAYGASDACAFCEDGPVGRSLRERVEREGAHVQTTIRKGSA